MKRILLSAACVLAAAGYAAGTSGAAQGAVDPADVPYVKESNAPAPAKVQEAGAAEGTVSDTAAVNKRPAEGQGGAVSPIPKN